MQNPFGKNGEIEIKPTTANVEIETKPIDTEEKKIKPINTEIKKSRKQKLLEQYGGLESNVPINSAYWKMKG